MAYTVDQLMDRLLKPVAPGNPAEFLRLLQEADDRLVEKGRWLWCRDVISLTPVDGIISLSAGYRCINAARVEGTVEEVHSREFEWMIDGPGDVKVDGPGDFRLHDLGLVTVDDEKVRQYKISGGIGLTDPLEVLATKAPADLSDADSMPHCPSLTALKHAMEAIVYEEASDSERGAQYWAMSVNALNEHSLSLQGGANQLRKSRTKRGQRSRPQTNFP